MEVSQLFAGDLIRYDAFKSNWPRKAMNTVYQEIESSLDNRKDELIDEGKQPSDDPVEVLNDIITPLFAAARQGAKLGGWSAEISHAPNVPNVEHGSEPTVEIEFWHDDKERASAASVMAYPRSNESVDAGLVITYSTEGSNAVKEMQLLPLDRYNPPGACSLMKEGIKKALDI